MFEVNDVEPRVFVNNLSSFATSMLRRARHSAKAWLPAQSAEAGFPEVWRVWLRDRVPLSARLPESLRLRHESLVLDFIRRKPFIGCAGFEVTEEVRVVVAGHACLLILGRGKSAFDPVREVLVYPAEFVTRRQRVGSDGLVHENAQVLRGESSSLGQVVLSWADAVHQSHAGQNLVIHEFAHQLDQAKGAANGAPFRAASTTQRQRWAKIMSREYAQHQRNTNLGEQTLLSPYGATNPAEFFAVCAEAFFELPQAMKYVHPTLYNELGGYFRLDPAAWFGAISNPQS
jgi:Mlc titration factor MtfA (ptsG expression regulator)